MGRSAGSSQKTSCQRDALIERQREKQRICTSLAKDKNMWGLDMVVWCQSIRKSKIQQPRCCVSSCLWRTRVDEDIWSSKCVQMLGMDHIQEFPSGCGQLSPDHSEEQKTSSPCQQSPEHQLTTKSPQELYMKWKFVVRGWWLERAGSCDGLPDPVRGMIPRLRLPWNTNTLPQAELLFAKVQITGKKGL